MSKRILFIAPYPFDEAPSQRFRFEQYFDYLTENGFELKEVSFLDSKGWNALYKEGSTIKKVLAMIRSFWRRFILLFSIRKYNHIFIHREASMIGPPVFEWFIAKVLRRRYIYDFDDAIWLPNYSDANAKFHKLKMYGKVRKVMKWADQVTTGNNFLADFAKQYNSNVQVIPTTVDMINVHNKQGNTDNELPIIGWTGSHTTSQYLKEILPVLDKIHESTPFKFTVISNQPPDFERPYLEFVKWNGETEIEDLAKFNIGIMPLKDSDWTKGKCGFKAIQYMSLGIPTVLSPVGVNKEIVHHEETGLFCSSNQEWTKHLMSLLQNPSLRSLIGLNGQKTIKSKYSVAANQDKYLQLFE